MRTGPSQPALWNFRAVVTGLAIGAILQFLVFPWPEKTENRLWAAICIDILVSVRMLVAHRRGERNKGWVFYALLPSVAIPVLEVAQALIR